MAIAYAITEMSKIVKKTRKPRRMWMREILKRRHLEGTQNILIPKLLSDEFHYKNFLRMDKDSFGFILNLVEPMLFRVDTKWRRCITVSERLTITLLYLATGQMSHYIKSFYFYLSKHTNHLLLTINAIIKLYRCHVSSPNCSAFDSLFLIYFKFILSCLLNYG